MADAFSLPGRYQQQYNEIARRQKMAEMLQAQAFAPDTAAPSYNGIPVPVSAFSGLSKALAGIGGGYLQNKAIEEQEALGEKAQTETKQFLTALQGTPRAATQPTIEDPEASGALPFDRGATFNADNTMTVRGTPAGFTPLSPAQKTAMLLGGMSSGNPFIQNIAGPLYAQSIKETKLAPGEAVFDSAGRILYGVDSKTEYGTTLQNITKDPSSPTGWSGMLPDKSGGPPKIIPVQPPTNQFTDQTANNKADLAQARFISDRAFNNLSAKDRASLEFEAARYGLSAADYYYRTANVAPPTPTIGANTPSTSLVPGPVTPPTTGSAPQLPKKLTDEALAAEISRANAADLLNNKRIPNAEAQIKTVSDIINNPNLKIVGDPYKMAKSFLPGSEGYGFRKLLDQIKSGAFLTAYDTLRGAAGITNIEGIKGTQAINRMSIASDVEDFKKAAKDYTDVIERSIGQNKLEAMPREERNKFIADETKATKDQLAESLKLLRAQSGSNKTFTIEGKQYDEPQLKEYYSKYFRTTLGRDM